MKQDPQNPLEQLADLTPEPNPQTRARHIAAASAAFAQFNSQQADVGISTEKNILSTDQ